MLFTKLNLHTLWRTVTNGTLRNSIARRGSRSRTEKYAQARDAETFLMATAETSSCKERGRTMLPHKFLRLSGFKGRHRAVGSSSLPQQQIDLSPRSVSPTRHIRRPEQSVTLQRLTSFVPDCRKPNPDQVTPTSQMKSFTTLLAQHTWRIAGGVSILSLLWNPLSAQTPTGSISGRVYGEASGQGVAGRRGERERRHCVGLYRRPGTFFSLLDPSRHRNAGGRIRGFGPDHSHRAGSARRHDQRGAVDDQ